MEIITKYFSGLTDHQINQFAQLKELYTFWNDQINVISRKDIDELYERHVLHSLAIAKVVSFQKGTRVLDVGTGGGFPGIPLAILFPDVEFHLVDSIGKKIKVVKEVAEALGLKNLSAEQQRAEKVSGQFDFVVSRAVTRMKPFLAWVRQKVKVKGKNSIDNGILALKGGDLDEELDEVKRPYMLYDLCAYFDEPFFETKKIAHLIVH